MRDYNYDTLRSANFARQQEWDTDNQITASYRANELAGELGEALERALEIIELSVVVGKLSNTIKKLERERLGINGSRTSREELAKELADVVICTDLVAMMFDVDLDAATKAKFNETSEKVGLKTRFV